MLLFSYLADKIMEMDDITMKTDHIITKMDDITMKTDHIIAILPELVGKIAILAE